MITTTETSTGLLEETLEERRHPYRHSRLSERLRYPLEGSNPCPGTHPGARRGLALDSAERQKPELADLRTAINTLDPISDRS
jgi:hypothetical protein